MSVSCDSFDGYCDVWSETEHKARKQKRCNACARDILPGHRFGKTSSLYEGSWKTTYRCMPCQTIYEHLREKCDRYNVTRDKRYDDAKEPEVALNCGLDYEEEWGPCPDEIAALAFALPGDFE